MLNLHLLPFMSIVNKATIRYENHLRYILLLTLPFHFAIFLACNIYQDLYVKDLAPGADAAPLFLDFFNFAVCWGGLFKVSIEGLIDAWAVTVNCVALMASSRSRGLGRPVLDDNSVITVTATFIKLRRERTDQPRFHLGAVSFLHHYK